MGDLLEFYGTECVECRKMEPLIERLEAENGAKVERFEVWHNYKNQELMMKYATGKCMAAPFFYNKKTGDFICGSASYERLKTWAGVQ